MGAQTRTTAAASPLTKYFMVVLFLFASLSLMVNTRFVHDLHTKDDGNVVKSFLNDFRVSNMQQKIEEVMQKTKEEEGTGTNEPEGDDDGGSSEEEEEEEEEEGDDKKESNEEDKDAENEGKNSEKENDADADADEDENSDSSEEGDDEPKSHTIANLSCEAYGGPSPEESEEMVYWEDIPKDALHVSPFHNINKKQDGDIKPITQFLTFEPDAGGWNNIRMAMETVLALAFAMGRTLVLPPHQGMYLIDKNENGKQKNKFSFDNFFHMQSISNEHIGLDIITTKEFLEMCAQGKIVDAELNPIYPPDMRTDWDGAPYNELQKLKQWLRERSGKALPHWDPDRCIAAFPASDSEEDAKKLASLPDEIRANGGFPHYQQYIKKPNDVDAPVIERLKEFSADRQTLCEYTPDLQNTQWVHFPVGMKTESGDSSRLLVHFYTFLFFQDWKEDLWMKRFVRDHVRYIDEIQCAAARVVAAVRKRVSERTKGASTDFDTIHIRRGDFQFKETRVEAPVILEQLKRVLDAETTLYIATDERDKSFFKPIVDYYPDVVFLDDVMEELGDINTNYFGMIDQLVASRGKTFFGCWFSTFTGYINRLRGYHADDHEMPGYEQGIINSYYYAMPDRFDHMREYWPIKKQFYAREFPDSWRLIDSSI